MKQSVLLLLQIRRRNNTTSKSIKKNFNGTQIGIAIKAIPFSPSLLSLSTSVNLIRNDAVLDFQVSGFLESFNISGNSI